MYLDVFLGMDVDMGIDIDIDMIGPGPGPDSGTWDATFLRPTS